MAINNDGYITYDQIKKIEIFLENRGITQTSLAEMAKIGGGKCALSSILAGKRPLSRTNLAKLCKVIPGLDKPEPIATDLIAAHLEPYKLDAGAVTYRMRDALMEPVIRAGQRVLLDKLNKPENGDPVFIRLHSDGCFVRRYFYDPEAKQVMLVCMDTCKCAPKSVKISDVAEVFKIRGVLYE